MSGWRPLQRVLLLGAVALLAACSMAGLAYNNIVTLAAWYADDYVALDELQRDRFRQSLERLHLWHRRSELPEYSRLLEDAARQVDGPVRPEQVLRLYADGRRVLERLAEQALPDVAELLRTLTPAQIDSIEARLNADNARFEQERLKLPPDRRERERRDRYLRSVENWIGPLSEVQRAQLGEGLAAAPSRDELRFADRKRLQAEFLALLRAAPSQTRMREALRRLLLSPEIGRSPAYQAELRNWQNAHASLLSRLINDATPQQRRHFQKRLRAYASDAQALAARL